MTAQNLAQKLPNERPKCAQHTHPYEIGCVLCGHWAGNGEAEK